MLFLNFTGNLLLSAQFSSKNFTDDNDCGVALGKKEEEEEEAGKLSFLHMVARVSEDGCASERRTPMWGLPQNAGQQAIVSLLLERRKR